MITGKRLSCSIDLLGFFILCRWLVRLFPASWWLESLCVKECSLKAFYCHSTNLLVRDTASLCINEGHVSLIHRGGSRGLRLVLLCSLGLRLLLGALLVLCISLRPFFKIDSLRDAPELLRACVELVNLFLL